MSENNEGQNEFLDEPVANAPVQTPAEEAAPTNDPSAVQDAVKRAIAQQGVSQIQLAPCPCGVEAVNLMIDIGQGNKVGRATCGACGIWGVDFLAPRSQDQELLGKSAAKAWNEAPRIMATDPA